MEGPPAPSAAGQAAGQPAAAAQAAPQLPDFDCAVCSNVLVDPVVGGCGHDFCLHCLETWTIDFGRTTCPVCRAALPRQTPGICLRLKAAVEAVAGEQVAARRADIAQEVEERRQRREQQEQRRAWREAAAVVAASAAASASRPSGLPRSPAGQHHAARLDAEAGQDFMQVEMQVELRAIHEALQRQAAREVAAQQRALALTPQEARSVDRQQWLASALPGPLPPSTPYPHAPRQPEESRWLCYGMGWPQAAAAQAAAHPGQFSQRLAQDRAARLASLPADLPMVLSVQQQLALVQQQLPTPAAAAAGSLAVQPPQELSREESRWHFLQAVGPVSRPPQG